MDLLASAMYSGHSPDPMQVAIPVLLIISASPTNNTPPPHLPSSSLLSLMDLDFSGMKEHGSTWTTDHGWIG
jgi:hypothetical protein